MPNKKKKNIISYGKQTIEKDDINAVIKVLKSQNLTQGLLVSEFERKLCEYFNSKYCIVVSNGTAALHLAGKALEWSSKDTIITTPITFVATANSILYSDANPVFVDIDKNTYNIDLNKLEEKIKTLKKLGKKVSAVIGVDYSGNPCDWESLRYLANKYLFKLINDNCHAIGSKYNNNKGYAVKYADLVTHSYHAVKNITTGEGGCVLTNSKRLADKIRLLRTHGVEKLKEKHWSYKMDTIGFNYRLTDFQCALGINQLSKLDNFILKKRKNALKYQNAFNNIENIITPMLNNKNFNSYHFYPIRIKNIKSLNHKNNFLNILKRKNIFLQVHYIPIFYYNYYKKLFKFNLKDFKESVKFYKEEFSLPTYPLLKNYEINYVINNIKSLLKNFE